MKECTELERRLLDMLIASGGLDESESPVMVAMLTAVQKERLSPERLAPLKEAYLARAAADSRVSLLSKQMDLPESVWFELVREWRKEEVSG